MQDQRLDHVWLDLRPVGEDRLARQFPTILGRCRELGLEPLREPIPVAPAAHYWMGGVSTDLDASTSIKGLYAVGEVACTGVHGANRLASNSLMECLVFARQLRRIELAAQTPGQGQEHCHHVASSSAQGLSDGAELGLAALRSLCWRVAGVEREGGQLRRGLRVLREWTRPDWADGPSQWVAGLNPGEQLELEPQDARRLLDQHELSQQLVLARLLLEAAAFREESRGGHFRLDAPASQPFWARHSLQRRGEPIGTAPLGAPFKG
jgi:L-aspartate oxidase